jgi:hypothetical protein
LSFRADGVLNLGHSGQRGYINLFNTAGDPMMGFDGEQAFVRIGGRNQSGIVEVTNDRGDAKLGMNGHRGHFETYNTDCAELFDIADGTEAEPGTVMVIDHDRTVRASEVAYDTRVAGAVSGAGSTQPGLLLGVEGERSVPIALAGTVTVKMTADERPVEVGDLVVSSPVTGHAMAAEDPTRSFGAVIGKTLGSLRNGQGLVPILVSLQ